MLPSSHPGPTMVKVFL
jgi:hypothetical protein